MLRVTRSHESSTMTALELFSHSIEQMKFLKEAADGQKGMIALLIPFLPNEDHETTVAPPELTSSQNKDEIRPDQIGGGAASLAEQFIRLRRRRDRIFGTGIFAEPAWDMLLDLFLAREKGLRPVSITSLCIASAVPATTALRWIETLVQQGLLSKAADPTDGRRIFVHLTNEAWQKMRDLLTHWADKP